MPRLSPKFAPLALIALAALAACHKGEVAGQKDSAPKLAAAADVKPLPGLWESTAKIEKMDLGEAMPPQVRAQVEKAMGMQKVGSSCLSAADIEKPKAGFFNQQSGCTYQAFSMSGGKITGVMSCANQVGGTQTVKLSGSYSATSYDMHIDSEAQLPNGMGMTTSMAISSRRVGDCTGKEAG